ncbi:MAG: methyltransferase [Chitinophagales bacterium]|jgi:2-polyprenyl-3-methyl-5-hydroxy-6-metoxy-1,4-benzoquinol methylase|nr:methyltransferase [Chitinophagales bacterium]
MKKTLKWRLAQNIELKWWQRYLQSKDQEAYGAWKLQYWADLLRVIGNVVKLPNNSAVLDAGCGPAGIYRALPHCRVTAIDPLLAAYEQNLTLHFNPADYPYVTFRAMPLEQLTDIQQYDVVFCLNVINHVSDIKLCIQKLYDALVPNGYLVLSIDAHNHNVFKWLFRAIPLDILHPHQHNLEGYKQLLPDNAKIRQEVLYKKEFFFNYHVLVIQKPA